MILYGVCYGKGMIHDIASTTREMRSPPPRRCLSLWINYCSICAIVSWHGNTPPTPKVRFPTPGYGRLRTGQAGLALYNPFSIPLFLPHCLPPFLPPSLTPSQRTRRPRESGEEEAPSTLGVLSCPFDPFSMN